MSLAYSVMLTTSFKPTTGLLALTLLFGAGAQADGMIPDTSVVIVYEAEGEAAVSVTNTDSQLALLHVTLEDIPEDPEPLLVVTPPLSRVEPYGFFIVLALVLSGIVGTYWLRPLMDASNQVLVWLLQPLILFFS